MKLWGFSAAILAIFITCFIFVPELKWIIGLACLGLWAILLLWAVFDLRGRFFLNTIYRSSGTLLTFDDGPDPERTPQILDLLKEKQLSAVFFVIGKKAEQHPEIIQRADAEGHAIENHGHVHSMASTFWDARRYEQNLNDCSEAVERATGSRPKCFRPPYGVSNPKIGKAVRSCGLSTLGWTVRSLDTFYGSARVLARCKRLCRKGSIVLLHDTGSLNMVDLEELIDDRLQKGDRFANGKEFIDALDH